MPMIAVRQHPELATRSLWDWLKRFVDYTDRAGNFGKWLVDDATVLEGPLASVAAAACPGVTFSKVILHGYEDGKAITPCHSDHGATGFAFILSLGATRTFRIHRVPEGMKPTAGCGDYDLEARAFETVNGTCILMDEEFQAGWHHQVAPDPGQNGEKLSLVFRTQPQGK